MSDKAIVKSDVSIQKYLRSAPIVQRFEDVLGKGQAMPYISSVLLAVAESKQLQECSPQSIAVSALRAAGLRLNCDPAIGQAYLVPYKGKATFIAGYKGLQAMAIRTGKYRVLNVAKIYKGLTVTENPFTGLHSLEGAREGNEVQGYMLYFELRMTPTGEVYKKSFYMSVEEILEHAAKYSKSFSYPDSPWKKSPEIMMEKTVLRLGLTRYGYLDPNDKAMLGMEESEPEDAEVMSLPDYGEVVDDDVIEGEIKEPEQIMSELGYEPEEKPKSSITKKAARVKPYIKNEGDLAGYKAVARYYNVDEELAMSILKECGNDCTKAGVALEKQIPPVEQKELL